MKECLSICLVCHGTLYHPTGVFFILSSSYVSFSLNSHNLETDHTTSSYPPSIFITLIQWQICDTVRFSAGGIHHLPLKICVLTFACFLHAVWYSSSCGYSSFRIQFLCYGSIHMCVLSSSPLTCLMMKLATLLLLRICLQLHEAFASILSSQNYSFLIRCFSTHKIFFLLN